MGEFGALVIIGGIILGIILVIGWIILPFAIIGTKPILRQILAEQIRTRELLDRRLPPYVKP